MKSKFLYAFCICCCFLVLVGCSKLQRLNGKVTYEDGTPVPIGTVIFVQGSMQSRGDIRNGEYQVGTNADKDGLPPGEYQVYITNAFDSSGTQLLDEKYTSAATSGITYKSGTSPFDIKVERPKIAQ